MRIPGGCSALFVLAALAAGFVQSSVAQSRGFTDATPAANTAIASHDWPQALAQLDQRIASNPHDVQAQFKRATVLARMGRTDAAITAFTSLTQQYPELPEPYINLAALQAQQGHLIEARAALETAMQTAPTYALTYRNLGDVYLKLASQAYAKAGSLDATDRYSAQRAQRIDTVIAPPGSVAALSAAPPRRPAAAAAGSAASATSAAAAASAPLPASAARSPAH
ncbi:MAG: tetratricopeptide repeat protein [Janthinobacterium lividum]